MSEANRALLDARQADIERSARIYGYAADASYRIKQTTCPTAPGYLLLNYESSPGKVSRFSAVIPRSAGGSISIIPVLLAGAVPLQSAWSSLHSMAVFNRIQSSPVQPSGMLEGALCYVALVGETPEAFSASRKDAAMIGAPAPTQRDQRDGRKQEIFSTSSGAHAYKLWTLTFNRAGELVRVLREEHAIEQLRASDFAISRSESAARAPIPSAVEVLTPASAPAAPSKLPETEGQTVSATVPSQAVVRMPAAVVQSTKNAPSPAPTRSLSAPKSRFVPEPPPPPGRFIPSPPSSKFADGER